MIIFLSADCLSSKSINIFICNFCCDISVFLPDICTNRAPPLLSILDCRLTDTAHAALMSADLVTLKTDITLPPCRIMPAG